MKQVNRRITLLILLLLLVACSRAEGQAEPTGTNNEAATATTTETPLAEDSTPASEQTNRETNSTDTADTAGLPVTLAALLPNADVDHGRELTVQYGCTACHTLEQGVTVVGPSWYNVGTVAATRVPGENAALYLYNSILHPNQHVVEGFLPNLMPQTYGDQLSEQEVADIIQYLSTLQE